MQLFNVRRLALLLLVLAWPAFAAPFTNGGFDTGALSPWSQTNGDGTENWNITSAVSQAGGFSATNIGNSEIQQNFTPYAAGSIAVLSFWLQTQTVGQQESVDLFYAGGQFTEFGVSTSTTGFNYFDETYRIDTTKALTGIGVYGATGARTYLDSVTITQTPAPLPEAPSLALLAASVMGVLLWRARRGSAPPEPTRLSRTA